MSTASNTPASRKRSAAPAARKKPAAKASAPAAVKEIKAKTDKVKKPKVVRDSFTFPKDEYATLAQFKQRAIDLAHPIKKAELLRAGLKALGAMTDAQFLAALRAVPSIKTGRPKKD